MKTHMMMHPRAEELLVERALRPLTDVELAELVSLGVDIDDSFDMSAASVLLATTRVEAMPADMLERVTERSMAAASPPDFRRTIPGIAVPGSGPRTSDLGPRMADTSEARGPRPEAPPGAPVIPIDRARKRRVSAAWVAAAAAAGIAFATGVSLLVRRGDGTPASGQATPAPSVARADLLGGGTRALAWTASADATATGASGDVVWSDAQQRGYMRFVGLAVNDPKAWQYQLWIFDRTRDEAFPVDGGVFDVTASGEIIVPISAKLHVDQATLFAVTVERPGGVVVSKRERIVVTAKPS